MSESLSIGDLAARTGIAAATLRTWHTRFGFPAGTRTGGGHRRFTSDDVDLVRRVREAQDGGLPLALAVSTVLSQESLSRQPSVFGALMSTHPELRPARLSRSLLLTISHALEDECLARGEPSIVLGSFQSGRAFARASRRWTEIARATGWCAVVADFGGEVPTTTTGPLCCDLPATAAMRREWAVVCLDQDRGTVLSGWEIPGSPARQRFEVVLSTRPDVALTAAQALTGVLAAHGAPIPAEVTRRLAATPTRAPQSDTTDTMLSRLITYLAEEHR